LSFLLWDGETINGERYDPEAHQINIRVTHYASRVEGQLPAADVDPVVNELVVRLGDMETVSDLKTRIVTLTGIPVDKQYLCRIEYQYVSCCVVCCACCACRVTSCRACDAADDGVIAQEIHPFGREQHFADPAGHLQRVKGHRRAATRRQ
jgi:hypothetical protein